MWFRRAWPFVEGRYVFILRNREKDLSAMRVVTGMVRKSLRSFNISGRSPASPQTADG